MDNCLTIEHFKKYDSGLLNDVERRRVRDHLAICAGCRTAFDRWRSSSPPSTTKSTLVVPAHGPEELSSAQIAVQSLPQVEGYRITGVLGQGGMGVVYRAVQIKLNRIVALKLLPMIVASPQAVSRFRREAKAAARLHHTHIVPIYDFGESKAGHFYAMELIEGQPLNDLIKKFAEQNITSASQARVASVLHKSVSGLPVPATDAPRSNEAPSSAGGIDSSSSTGKGRAYYHQVARWMADAADALHYAHNEGIIHRDIKPGNLILSKDARIMITDFGLAKCSDDESVTVPGAFLGAIRYVSPEQAMAGRVRVDHRTDIYSLGATMYELLALQPAFPGNDEKEILASIIARDPTPLRKAIPTLPAELETICQKTLEKLPDARYESARALAEDLRRFLNDLPIVAKRPGIVSRALKFFRRHRAAVIAVASAFLLAGTSAVLYRERGRRIDEERQRQKAELKNHLEQGDLLLEAHNWSEAGDQYEATLKLDPDNLRALVHLAIVKKETYNASLPHSKSELLANAIQLCDHALQLDPMRKDPTATTALNTKGVVLKILDRLDDAAAAYGEVIAIKPEWWVAWVNLATVNFLRRQLDTAEDNLRKAAHLVVPSDPKMSCSVFRELAVVQLLQREEEAAPSIERALICDSSNASYLLVRARIRLTQQRSLNEIEEARFDASSADRLPNDEGKLIKRYLALACLRLGRFQEAIDNANKAIAQGDAKTYNQLMIAIAERQLGHIDAAKKALGEALDNWPDELRKTGDYKLSAVKGFFWFESGDDLLALRTEIERLLATP